MVQAGEHLRDLDSSVIPVLPSRYQYYCSIVPRRGTAFFTVTLHSPKGGTKNYSMDRGSTLQRIQWLRVIDVFVVKRFSTSHHFYLRRRCR